MTVIRFGRPGPNGTAEPCSCNGAGVCADHQECGLCHLPLADCYYTDIPRGEPCGCGSVFGLCPEHDAMADKYGHLDGYLD